MNPSTVHYDTHLGRVYSWMVGDFDAALSRSSAELEDMRLPAKFNGNSLDLGAGLGVHSLALAKRGFRVTAIDSCKILLDELRSRIAELPITIIEADLTNFRAHAPETFDAIICMGDTLTHLPSLAAVEALLSSVAEGLSKPGMFAATFRDYASETPDGGERSILVKRDENRILTCVLKYAPDIVTVHDVLTERQDGRWIRRESSYPKLRLAPEWVAGKLEGLGLSARCETAPAGMIRIVARATAV